MHYLNNPEINNKKMIYSILIKFSFPRLKKRDCLDKGIYQNNLPISSVPRHKKKSANRMECYIS